MPKNNNLLTIKKFSILTKTSIDTLKHYDRIGILRPAVVGENLYRYYLPEQALTLTRILFGVRAGISLKQIKAMIEGSSPQETISAYDNIFSRLDEEIRQLQALQNTIRNLRYYYQLAVNNPPYTIFSHYFPEWYMIQSPKLKIGSQYESSASNIANDLFVKGFYKNYWPHYQLGACFSEKDFQNKSFKETTYFLKVDYPEQYSMDEIKFVPAGNYICYITQVQGKNLPKSLNMYRQALQKSSISIEGYIFALDIINNMLTADTQKYLTLLFALEAPYKENDL